MSLAWCGCTTFDQTIPEGVHFMGLASCCSFPIKLTVYTLCYGCGLFSLEQTVPYGEDIMA